MKDINNKTTLTLVIPVYNEQESIVNFWEETNKIEKEMYQVDFEYLFVNDGSTDKTLEILKNISEKHSNIHYISFSRNFGKEAAIYAGLQHSKGDYTAILDVDLQDPPSLIPEMFKAVTEEGFDCVGSRRVTRSGEPIIRSYFARLFYKIINKISKTEIVDGARDFQLMSRKVVDAILQLKEYNRFSKGIFGWVGFKRKWIEYENIERTTGSTKWSFWSLFIYALDGIIAFSTVPLVVSSILGIIFCLISFIMIVVIILKTLIFGDPTSGWPSMACLIMFMSGIQLLFIGVLGQYAAKIYLEIKKRPIYLIEEAKLN